MEELAIGYKLYSQGSSECLLNALMLYLFGIGNFSAQIKKRESKVYVWREVRGLVSV